MNLKQINLRTKATHNYAILLYHKKHNSIKFGFNLNKSNLAPSQDIIMQYYYNTIKFAFYLNKSKFVPSQHIIMQYYYSIINICFLNQSDVTISRQVERVSALVHA